MQNLVNLLVMPFVQGLKLLVACILVGREI